MCVQSFWGCSTIGYTSSAIESPGVGYKGRRKADASAAKEALGQVVLVLRQRLIQRVVGEEPARKCNGALIGDMALAVQA